MSDLAVALWFVAIVGILLVGPFIVTDLLAT
jgi:hypothetical protein